MPKKEITAVEDGEKINSLALDRLDMDIINELLDYSDSSSSDIARKFDKPLSTIQRRRTRLENSILKKDYFLNQKYTSWRSGEIFVRVMKGKTEEVAKEMFEKYDNNITMVSTTMNNVGNLIIHIYFRNSPQMFGIIEDLRKVPYAEDVLYAEHIEKLNERKPRFILEDLKKVE